ncbi:hypothetical protein WG66_004553 [Moniliophthora roreri]|nr:hypothetical protein WG66_004553 [Moniliophthora roreri]KAI3607845.1 hypothetical protein WG66_004553 [Moniliophthora roreri]
MVSPSVQPMTRYLWMWMSIYCLARSTRDISVQRRATGFRICDPWTSMLNRSMCCVPDPSWIMRCIALMLMSTST